MAPPLLAEPTDEGRTEERSGKGALTGWEDSRPPKLSELLTTQIRLTQSHPKCCRIKALPVKYERDHRQPAWFRVKNRAADDIYQDDNADSASHFPKCHFDVRKSNGLPTRQANTAVKFHFTKCTYTYTHAPTGHVSGKVTQHTDTGANTTGKMNTRTGRHARRKRHRHTHTDVHATHRHVDTPTQPYT